MKIRNGFISNSSSSSFIIGIDKTYLEHENILAIFQEIERPSHFMTEFLYSDTEETKNKIKATALSKYNKLLFEDFIKEDRELIYMEIGRSDHVIPILLLNAKDMLKYIELN